MPLPPAPATRLTDYFSSRIEQGDVITYRKHGYVLFKKVWLPSLFMILILAGVIYLLYLSISGSLEFPSTIAILLFGLFLLSLPTIGWLYQYIDWRNDIEECLHVERVRLPTGRLAEAPVSFSARRPPRGLFKSEQPGRARAPYDQPWFRRPAARSQ